MAEKLKTDVAIIGAGPAGAVTAALIRKLGHEVTVLEQNHFPRFSIGESLLPQCMEFIAEAGMAKAVEGAGFQHKNGAVFACDGTRAGFDFRTKFTGGPGTTYQVERARFDQILASCAERAGAAIHYGHEIIDVSFAADNAENVGKHANLAIRTDQGERYRLDADFVIDASGFGRVLPRLLTLETPSGFPSRTSLFTHIQDNIAGCDYDRDKILIVVHPQQRDIWYWLIPFSNGRASIGVVARNDVFDKGAGGSFSSVNNMPGEMTAERIRAMIEESPDLSRLLKHSVYDSPIRSIRGYAANVRSLWGSGFALLGNAGEFLDPIFSSGVTIAMKSASLAAPLVSRQLQGETVDWQTEYADKLNLGINTFRACVDRWYDGSLQDIIFARHQQPNIREMICSILAGYVWDTNNPFVAEPQRRLNALAEICRDQQLS